MWRCHMPQTSALAANQMPISDNNITDGDHPVDDDADRRPEPETIVFRLSWSSLTNTLISAAVLRDHYLTHTLPPVNVETQVPVLTKPAYVTLLTTTQHAHTKHFTKVFLLPPIPPSLQSPSLQPLSESAFQDPALPRLLALSLNPHPLLHTLCLPPPQVFLIHAPRGAGITSTLASISLQSHATFIYLPATHLLRHTTTPKSLHTILLHYLAAARATSPAIIFLDDASFLFPHHQSFHATSFIHFIRSLTSHPHPDRVAVVVGAAPDVHVIHPIVVEACHIVLPLAINPSGEWALQLAAKKTRLDLETVRSRVSPYAVTTISDTIHRARQPLEASLTSAGKNAHFVERWQAISGNLGGMSHALKVLRRMLLYPKTKATSLRRFNVTPAKGLLLYGPPGTGKTHLVREAAAATNHPVLPVDAAGLARGEVGASERLLTQAFVRAESVAPCIVFLDEIDALFASSSLGRLVAVLALRMDTAERVIVIGATNKPWLVSKALLRPGRFEYVVKVPLPSAGERNEIAKVYAAKMELDVDRERYLCKLATGADGFSGADIAGACRRACMSALSRDDGVDMQDISDGFAAVQPSVESQVAQQIDDW